MRYEVIVVILMILSIGACAPEKETTIKEIPVEVIDEIDGLADVIECAEKSPLVDENTRINVRQTDNYLRIELRYD